MVSSMMKVTDPELLAQLNGTTSGTKVTDPNILAQLNDNKPSFLGGMVEDLGQKARTVGRGAANFTKGVAGIIDLPVNVANLISNAMVKDSGTNSPFQPIAEPIVEKGLNVLDPNGVLNARTTGERYTDTLMQMIGGGPKTAVENVLPTVLAASGMQTAKEANLGPVAQILSALAGGSIPGAVKGAKGRIIADAQKQMQKDYAKVDLNTLDPNQPLIAQNVTNKTVRRMAEGAKRNPELINKSIQNLKGVEATPFQGINPVSKQLELRSGVSKIAGDIKEAGNLETKPFYDASFKTADTYDVAKNYFLKKTKPAIVESRTDPLTGLSIAGKNIPAETTVTLNPQIQKLNKIDDFRAAKNTVLGRTRPEEIAKGYYDEANDVMSNQMISDINSELKNWELAAKKSTLPEAKKMAASYRQASTETMKVLKSVMPENKFLLRETANKKYKAFNDKLDSILGKNKKGDVGAILKYSDIDAQVGEDIVSQTKKVFEAQPEIILKVRNTFNQYGVKDKWDNAFTGYVKNKIDSLKPDETLYDTLRVPLNKAKFEAGLPDTYKGVSTQVFKIGDNLQKVMDNIGQAKPVSTQQVKDVARSFALQSQGASRANLLTQAIPVLRRQGRVDKQIADIMFDPKLGKEFITKFKQQKTLAAQNKFTMQYLIDHAPATLVPSVATGAQQ